MAHVRSTSPLATFEMASSFGSERPPLVLLATGDEWTGRAIESVLRPDDYAVVRAGSGRHAVQLARAVEPDAIILDCEMPNLGGLDVCRILRDDARFQITPILLLSPDSVVRGQRMTAYAAGAWAIFGAPLDGELFLTQLRNFVHAKLACSRFQSESLLDDPTGLYSIRGLRCRLKEMAGEAQRTRAALTCIVFGPDERADERAEERAGRAASVLSERAVVLLSHLLRRESRCSDALGRISRTDVAVVAPATAESGALRLIERYRNAAESAPLDVDGVPRQLHMYAGYVAADFGTSRLEGSELLLQAIAALRLARTAEQPVMSFADTARPH